MKPTENPNIFDYATSELSQDAFICYMLNFPEAAKLFLQKCHIENEKILDIKRQHIHIDILVETDKHYLIIEDKTGTDEHDDQICHYVKELRKNYPNGAKKIRVCYLKTHDFLWNYRPPENNEAELKEEDCDSLNRDEILDILKNVTKDKIFEQFKLYLEAFDVDTSVSISKWGRKHWFKFLEPLIKKLKEENKDLWADIGYVSNRSGGFYGCWWGGDENTYEGHILYKQIEIKYTDEGTYEVKLCYKVQTKKPKSSSEQRPKVSREVLNQIKDKFKEKRTDFKVTGRCSGWSTTYAKKEFTKDSKVEIIKEDLEKAIKKFIQSDLY